MSGPVALAFPVPAAAIATGAFARNIWARCKSGCGCANLMKLSRLTRSEYIWQPGQLFRRAWRQLTMGPDPSRTVVRLPWGFPLKVDPRESIGRAIVALDVYDLPVTETIWRLVDAGETCADIGANIGHMTSVMAARLKNGGTIYCFEPLPQLAAVLRENVAGWKGLTKATIHLRQEALADEEPSAVLHLPVGFPANQGTASLDPSCPGFATSEKQLTVVCRRLDDVITADTSLGLVKVDVEGCEARVFRGAEQLLSSGRVRDIIFEEHRPPPAESIMHLQRKGYRLYRIIRHWRGPKLVPPDHPDMSDLDPPAFLATLDSARVSQRFAPTGWLCFR